MPSVGSVVKVLGWPTKLDTLSIFYAEDVTHPASVIPNLSNRFFLP